MPRIPNIATAMKHELSSMLCPGESKKQYMQETKEKRAAAKAELQKQGFPKEEIYTMLQNINTYRDKIFSYKTLEVYCKAANAFENFCEETLGTKRIPLDECPNYIDEFIQWGIERQFTPDTIHTYLAGITKALRLNIGDYEKPKRSYINGVRGVAHAQNDAYNEVRSQKALKVNRLIGLRRAELRRLKLSDIHILSDTYAEVRTKGKGGKNNVNVLHTPQEVAALRAYVEEATIQGRKYLLAPEDMQNDADLHHMRALRAQDVYEAIVKDMQEYPEHREYYREEIRKAFIANGKKLRENLDAPYRCRGAQRKQLLKMGQPVIFDRVAVLYVSCFVTNHFRTNVTVQHYLIKK